MISEKIFIQVIENLHQQYLQDKEYVEGISAVFGTDMPLYDNSHLLKSSLELLRVFFPKDEEGFCEIEHFCYVCEFGKVGSIKTSYELYEHLLNEKMRIANKEYENRIANCNCSQENKSVCMYCYMHGYAKPLFELSGLISERVKPE